MATFVLIHGAGHVGWYWYLVAADLRDWGHDTVSPDRPCDDEAADLIVVAPPGDFTAPVVCARVAVRLLVLVAPMIPAPGETPG